MRCVTIYDLEFSLNWPSETLSRTVVMHEGELWLIWVFKKKKNTTLSGYRYISGIQHSILDQTSALIGSWLALQRSWQRSRSAWPPTLCVHAQHYTSLPLVPSTDEEIKTNGCSSGFWSVFWLPITLPGGIATLSVICLQCLLRVQSIFKKSAELLC